MNALTEFQSLLRCTDSAPQWLKESIRDLEPIGSGAFASVFALNHDQVLKVLSEKTSIALAKWAKAHQPKGLARIDTVLENVLYMEGDRHHTLSVIVQERCTLDRVGIMPMIHQLNALEGGDWLLQKSTSTQWKMHQRFMNTLLQVPNTDAMTETLKSLALWIQQRQLVDPQAMLDIQSEENWARNKNGDFVLIDPVA